MSEKNVLLEKWQPLIESNKAKAVGNKEAMAQLLENQEKYVVEEAQNVAGDVAQYTPILVPTLRRIFPNLLANEIVGVQPMTMPTGYAYALRYAYAKGAGVNNANLDRGKFNRFTPGGGAKPTFGSAAIIFGAGVVPVVGDAVAVSPAGDAIGTVLYVEGNKALIGFAPGVTSVTVVGGTVDLATVAVPVSFVMDNEAGFNLIFKNYAQVLSTADGEQLGAHPTEEFRSMKMSLERVSVEAMTRKLKAEYTIELAQDLKAVHGLDAEAELINILEYEITAEIDRELVDQINGSATVAAGWSYGDVGQWVADTAAGAGKADGRWEAEKFRTLYTKIVREANAIALTSRRGVGNFIIASTNVVTALESLSTFMYSAVPGSVGVTLGVAKVGVLDGRFTVYLDTFAMTDYVTVGYKGPGAFDTGVIYCPYVPLMLQKVTDPATFQPKIAFMTRDAIAGNLFGAGNYYRTFAADFTGSTLGGPQFYSSIR